MSKFHAAWLLILIVSLVSSPIASAEVPYSTYTLNQQGEPLLTQTAYQPVGVIDGWSIVVQDDAGEWLPDPLFQPEDMFIDARDYIYVADTGNGRIVIFDEQGAFVRSIGEQILSRPTGVFVDEEGDLFIADYRQEKIYQFDAEGELKGEFGRPESLLFGTNTPFKPRKVIVDKRKNMYIVSEGSVQGLVQLSASGDFLGYFGGNRTSFDWKRALQRIFFTDTQLQRLERRIPPSITNVSIDDDGLVYTSTVGLEREELKKLNVAGNNLLPSRTYLHGERSHVADLTVDGLGNMYAVDSTLGRIYEYDREGNLLFYFGGSDLGSQRLGLFNTPVAIEVNTKGMLHVLDRDRGIIQILRPTEFTRVVHQAIAFYMDGRYTESQALWEEVLRYNSLFDLAHLGLGMASFKRGEYDQALEKFRFANEKKEYSNTFWEIRREWLMRNAGYLLLGGLLLAVSLWLSKYGYRRYGWGMGVVQSWQRMKRLPLLAELFHLFRVMRHPLDGYWELAREGKASVRAAHILYLLLFIVMLVEIVQTSFIFSSVDIASLDLLTAAYTLYLPLGAWIVSNYLVSTINDGEGRFRDVYIGTAYALGPYLVFAIPIALLSKVLTLMEAVIYDVARQGMLIWTLILIFLMVKEIHGFELGETVKNMLLTLAGMLVMGVLAFILFGLSNQVWDFLYSIYQEVKLRGH